MSFENHKRYDFRELLEHFSGASDWVEIDDIDDDYGRDYYFYAGDDFEAVIRVDNDRLTVRVNDQLQFDGSIRDPDIRIYVNSKQV